MKIVAGVTSYNESLFLDYVLKSIHDYVDEIVITDVAMKDIVDNGGSLHSSDGTLDIIKSWQNKSNKIHVIMPDKPTNTFAEISMYNLEMAKKLQGDWWFLVPGDEVYPANVIMPMRNFLTQCNKNGKMGVNLTMNYFCVDFWHCKDFLNPRIAKITADCCLPFTTEPVAWPQLGVWQTMETNVPDRVKEVNINYPKFLKVFHYSAVGYSRVKFKYDFYKLHKNNIGSNVYDYYMNKDLDYFEREEYHLFEGKHPKIMLNHSLYKTKGFDW